MNNQAPRDGTSCCCWSCIPQATVGIVERMGEFEDVLPPGCHFVGPLQDMKGTISLRVEMMHVNVDCPTKERTTVRCVTHVMYRVIPSYVHTAFYCLSGAREQITSYVQSALRSQVPNYTVDELYVTRYELADEVKKELEEQMTRFGHEIIDLLIADVDPIMQVKQMYSQQMARKYGRMANQYKIEAEKVEVIKKAEADAESARLAGIGLAEQRKVVAGSLCMNLHAWQEAEKKGHTIPESEVIATMLMLQYFDMMNDIIKQKCRSAPRVMLLPSMGETVEGIPLSVGGMRQRKKKVISDNDI